MRDSDYLYDVASMIEDAGIAKGSPVGRRIANIAAHVADNEMSGNNGQANRDAAARIKMLQNRLVELDTMRDNAEQMIGHLHNAADITERMLTDIAQKLRDYLDA